jgi:hypothetical protein
MNPVQTLRVLTISFLGVVLSGCFDYERHISYEGQLYSEARDYKELQEAPLLIRTSVGKTTRFYFLPFVFVTVNAKDSLYTLDMTLAHNIDTLMQVSQVKVEIADTLGNTRWIMEHRAATHHWQTSHWSNGAGRNFAFQPDFDTLNLPWLRMQPQRFFISYTFLFTFSSGRQSEFKLSNVPYRPKKVRRFNFFSI